MLLSFIAAQVINTLWKTSREFAYTHCLYQKSTDNCADSCFFSEAIVVYYHLISNLSKFLFVVSVTSITLVEIGILPNAAMLLLLSRVLFLLVTMAYYYHLGRKPKKIWAECVITSRVGTVKHRSQMRGQKVWIMIWLGLGALLCQSMPPAPFHRT